MFLGKTLQCDAVQCVLYYTRNTQEITLYLLLETSLYKSYYSEVHLLNQHSFKSTLSPYLARSGPLYGLGVN